MLLEVSDAVDLLHCLLEPQELNLSPHSPLEFRAQLAQCQFLVEGQKGSEIACGLNSFHCVEYSGKGSRLPSCIHQGLDRELQDHRICVRDEPVLDQRWSFLFIDEALMIAECAPLEKPIQHDGLT